ncbi:MAG: hypothetical protein HY587_00050 [Candidatus Omnitrophica bacterium]|nr:hypothetical protein [Candidatus Omnitrophota bacterium]
MTASDVFSRFLAPLFVFTIIIGAGSARADRVYLKTGDLIECIVVNEAPGAVNVQMEGGYVEFKRKEIIKIERQTDEENRALTTRWKLEKRGRVDFAKPKPSGCGQFFSVSTEGSRPAVSTGWVADVHETIQKQFLAFPPTAFILNLGPIMGYRRNNPQLYVLAFYSFLLLFITPVVALTQNGIITWWNAWRRKRSKDKLSSS